MSEKEAIMEVRNICKTFGPTVALKDVCIAVHRGEIRGLIGENGSGKSTVTSIYAGMQPADSGEMFFLGKPWHPESMVDAMSQGVGMIVQETGTVPGITVAENMFLGKADIFRMFRRSDGTVWGPINSFAMNRTAQKALDDIGAEYIRASQPTDSLDMQDRKLVEIAKIWMTKPELIVVDETTTALSQKGREIIYDLMNRMRDEGKAVIFISHDLEEIMERCNALTVLRDGKIIRTFSYDEFDADAIRTSMIGRELEGSYYRDDDDNRYDEETVLEIKDGTYKDRVIDLSLQAHKGEILGIGGLSHCGMHTLGKILYGDIAPEKGKVLVHGRNPAYSRIDYTISAIHPVGMDEQELIRISAAALEGQYAHPHARSILRKARTGTNEGRRTREPAGKIVWGDGVEAAIDGKTVIVGSPELLTKKYGVTLSLPSVSDNQPVMCTAIDGHYAGCFVLTTSDKIDSIPYTEIVKNEHFAMSRGIGYVAKDRDLESLNTETTIRDNVAIAGLDLIATKNGLIFSGREKAYVEKNIRALSTKCFSIDQPVSELSGGNKQKVVFAKWIGRHSDILILDCPTRGVDIGVKQAMYQLMYNMKLQGKTIIMISEEMTELMGMCDRLIIMKDGRITKEFNRSEGYDDNEIIKYMI